MGGDTALNAITEICDRIRQSATGETILSILPHLLKNHPRYQKKSVYSGDQGWLLWLLGHHGGYGRLELRWTEKKFLNVD